MNIIEDTSIIGANQLADIIKAHGPGMVSIDGSMPSPYEATEELGLCDSDTFRVTVNYGHEVQFWLVSDSMRAMVTTGLRGMFDSQRMAWVAEAA